MASVAVGHALIATKSTHSSAAIDSARSRSLKTGRPGPLCTKRSGVTVTTRTSPNRRADSKCLMCPKCRRSNTP